MPVPPRNVVVSPEATVPASSSVEVLVLATSRPVTFVAVMLLAMSSVPPLASTTPAPEIAPVIVPEPVMAFGWCGVADPPVAVNLPPDRPIDPAALLLMVPLVPVALTVPLPMVIEPPALLMLPLVAVFVRTPVPEMVIVPPVLLVKAPEWN